MRQYEDRRHYFDQHLNQAAEQYVQGRERAGLQPNDRLTRAIAERAVREAEEGYLRHVTEVRDHNLQIILHEHSSHMNTIKRNSTRLRVLLCLPIALLCAGLSCYSFIHPGGFIASAYLLYASVAAAFLAIVVLGAIFDRPIS